MNHLGLPALLLLLPCQPGICRLAAALEPVPEKLVVLTFDDSVKSHFTVVRPILLRYGFGATFFITEGFDFPTNKQGTAGSSPPGNPASGHGGTSPARASIPIRSFPTANRVGPNV